MKHTHTCLVESKVDERNNKNLSSPDFDYDLCDDTEELKKLVNVLHKRTFSEGLTRLLVYYAFYNGDLEDFDAKREFICEKLKCASGDKKTIFNWLKGVSEPDANEKTRDRIYRLCFDLSISTEGVEWFFNNVYFQRSFNCRRIEEAVYYYCFNNNHDYKHAQSLIADIQAFPEQEAPDSDTILYTTKIQKELKYYTTDEELKQYFRTNKWIFQEDQANRRAEEELRELLGEIQGKKTDKEFAEKVRDEKIKNPKESSEFANCGLIVQEVLSLNEPHLRLLEELQGKEKDEAKTVIVETEDKKKIKYAQTSSLLNALLDGNDISSTSIMLKCIYGRLDFKEDIHTKEIDLPAKRRENFPNEKVFSDLHLQEGGLCASKNYDAIRKCLILLLFYRFWCEYEYDLNPSKFSSDRKICLKTYESETNAYLIECGYDKLNRLNSYDRLFIYCSGSYSPLGTLRNFLSSTT